MSRQRSTLPESLPSAEDGDDEETYWTTPTDDFSKFNALNDHFLPPTIDLAYACNKCYAADGCMLYRKVHSREAQLFGSY